MKFQKGAMCFHIYIYIYIYIACRGNLDSTQHPGQIPYRQGNCPLSGIYTITSRGLRLDILIVKVCSHKVRKLTDRLVADEKYFVAQNSALIPP